METQPKPKSVEQTAQEKKINPELKRRQELPDALNTAKRIDVWVKADQVHDLMWEYFSGRQAQLPADQKKVLHELLQNGKNLPSHKVLEGLAELIQKVEPEKDPFDAAMDSMEASFNNTLSIYIDELNNPVESPEEYSKIIESMQGIEKSYGEFKAFRKEFNNVRKGLNPNPQQGIL